MIDNKRQELIHSQVMEILKENQLAFSNVARPKPTKASTATSASWSKDLAPKASAATQGAWDSTNTPGGVSSLAKEKWNVQEIAALVTKALESNNVKVAFSNSCTNNNFQFYTASMEERGRSSSQTSSGNAGSMGYNRYTRWTFF